jgi:hypothetical protein
MTVGIAVLCEGGNSVVVASDRMVAIEVGSTTIQAEVDCIKFERLNQKNFMLYTGRLHTNRRSWPRPASLATARPLTSPPNFGLLVSRGMTSSWNGCFGVLEPI